ncbi:SdpI family protein [Floccifex sp.]|uniref:SdpI family protein n=1 Tax=Floccifex sp. TaxID=2815810 RepID=UPI003F06D241
MTELTPVFILVIGYLFRNHYPKEINSLIGYRTRRSMMNEDTWNFANQSMSVLFIIWGWFLLFVTIGLDILFYKQIEAMSMVIVFMQLIPLFICIIQVEKKLKETFDEDGKRRFK